MTPYNLTFEQWLLKTNPELTLHDLYRHEELLGTAIQRSMEIEAGVRTPNVSNPDNIKAEEPKTTIDDLLHRANSIIPADKVQYVKNFWMKQKKYIAIQRDFRQMAFWKPTMWATSASFYEAYIRIQFNILIKRCCYLLKLKLQCLKSIWH